MSYGVGKGIDQGIKNITPMILAALKGMQQEKRDKLLLFNRTELVRGKNGLPPSYITADQDAADVTTPTVPSLYATPSAGMTPMSPASALAIPSGNYGMPDLRSMRPEGP